ncbi:MAG: hypothetical protein MK135_02870 [Polyangiaceae bacterium]|nr:hypothetical protein [Polyangiaceae bacterium]
MNARATSPKRTRDAETAERKKLKAEKRELRKDEKEERSSDEDEDPDLAGIVPGPQKLDPELYGEEYHSEEES